MRNSNVMMSCLWNPTLPIIRGSLMPHPAENAVLCLHTCYQTQPMHPDMDAVQGLGTGRDGVDGESAQALVMTYCDVGTL